MKKRLFSVLLSLCMVLALFPATAFAQEPDSLAIIVSGFQVGKTPADCKVNFVSTIPGVTFSEADIRFSDWRIYDFDGMHDMWNPINDYEVFQADTRYKFAIELDNKGLMEVPAVTVNGKTPQDCYLSTSNGTPIALFVGCELGTPAAGNEDREITVNGSFVPGAAADEIISVDVAWEAMDFTYTGASQGTWNPATHAYEGAIEGGWSDNTPAITVKNHSNVAVNATLGFTANVTGVAGTFTEVSGTENDNILNLATAEGTEVANAPTATANFGISGAAIDADQQLGTITVSIAKAVETATVVTTFEELQAEVNNGGTVKLGGDIALGNETLVVSSSVPVILDLNGYTLTSNNYYMSIQVDPDVICTIKNGTVTNTADMYTVSNFGTLTVQNCTLNANNRYPLYNLCTATVTDSTLNGNCGGNSICNDQAYSGTVTLTLSGTVNMEGGIYNNYAASVITVLPGTYSFNPTYYVIADAYTVTNNGDGTWTVTEK